MSYLIAAIVLALALALIVWQLRRPRGLGKKEVRDWIQAEQEADAASDQAETEATKKTHAIETEATKKTQAIDAETMLRTRQIHGTDSAQAEDALTDALDRYDKKHGRGKDLLNSLALLLLPTLCLLQACTVAHGSAGDTRGEYVRIKRSTWDRAMVAIEDCSAKLSKCKVRRAADRKALSVRCDRRVAQQRARTNACRKQRGILQGRESPSTMGRDIAIGVLVAYSVVATIVAVAVIVKPEAFSLRAGP